VEQAGTARPHLLGGAAARLPRAHEVRARQAGRPAQHSSYAHPSPRWRTRIAATSTWPSSASGSATRASCRQAGHERLHPHLRAPRGLVRLPCAGRLSQQARSVSSCPTRPAAWATRSRA
jgi:hypothetical protein